MGGTHSKKTAQGGKGVRQLLHGRVGSKRPLGFLLEHEDLLLKVLSYVMDDGLHECRLVCRQWRKACGKLPVKLERVRLDNLRKVPSAFPKASSLVLRHALCSTFVAESVVIKLAQLKNLRHLHLHLAYDQAACHSCKTLFSVMDRLKTLSLRVDDNDTLLDVFRLLRCLKNLLSLELVVDCGILTELDPVTELRGLKELTLDIQVLVNKRAELVFPSLTALSCLNIDARRLVRHPPYNTVDLKVNANHSRHALRFSCLML